MDEEWYSMQGMNAGEKQLYMEASRHASATFLLIPNAIFERSDGGTNQVDLIAVTPKGIFVMEMKDFSGWIFGNEHHAKWTQSLRGKWGKSVQYKFPNPIKQNENHIKTLKRVLALSGLDNLPIYNVVVFGSSATLKGVEASTDVVHIHDLDRVLEKYRDLDITEDEIDSVHRHITSVMLTGEDAQSRHIEYVRSFEAENQGEVESDSRSSYGPGDASPDERSPSRQPRPWTSPESKRRTTRYPRRRQRRSPLLQIAMIVLFVLWVSGSFGRSPKPTPSSPPAKTVTPPGGATGGSTSTPSQPAAPPAAPPSPPTAEQPVTAPLNPQGEPIFLAVGVKDQDVLLMLGEPGRVEKDGSQWLYGLASVSFDSQGQVSGWNNFQGNLNKAMIKPIAGSSPIDIGSAREDVLAALGSPEKIEPGKYDVWYYGIANVTFDQNGQVNGWNNYQGKLNAGMMKPVAGAEPIDIGSSREATLYALGSPEKILSGQYDVWYYGIANVTFDDSGQVNGWNNYQGKLNAGMARSVAGAAPIYIGSSRAATLYALGSPEKILSGQYDVWYYGIANVTFDQNGQVNGWNNYQGKLNAGIMKPVAGAEPIDIGSSREAALDALGSPEKILSGQYDVWYYGIANVTFDDNGQVNGWNNYQGKLNAGMMRPVAGAQPIDIGSSREATLDALGSPDKIEPGKLGTWYYGLASVSFDHNSQVNGWNNYQGKLNAAMMKPAVTDQLIQVGSDMAKVKLVLGSPTRIEQGKPDTWYYGLAYIVFDSRGKVTSWKDHSNTLAGKVSN